MECTSTLKNVESTLHFPTLIRTTLEKVAAMLLFSVSVWQRRNNDVNMFICKKNAEKRRINVAFFNVDIEQR